MFLLALISSVAMAGECKDLKFSLPIPEREIKYVIFHKPGPKFNAKDCFADPLIDEHKEYYLAAEDQLSQGGPFIDCTGGMAVLRKGQTLKEVCDLAENDPAVKGGVLSIEVHPWLDVMVKEK